MVEDDMVREVGRKGEGRDELARGGRGGGVRTAGATEYKVANSGERVGACRCSTLDVCDSRVL